MHDSQKTKPFVAEVRGINEINGQNYASFFGMNSWHHIPPNLKGVFCRAVQDNCPLEITITPSGIGSAELRSSDVEAPSVLGKWGRGAAGVLGKLASFKQPIP